MSQSTSPAASQPAGQPIVIIPMAGGDEAFRERGYAYCKSLIEIGGRALIEHVRDNLAGLGARRMVYVIRKEDRQRHHLDDVLRLMDPACRVIVADGPTAGAACTALLAIEEIAADAELVITNGDQLIAPGTAPGTQRPAGRGSLGQAVASFRERGLDAGTIVFESVHPRWSFVKLDAQDMVIEAAEKRPISRWATAGLYWFARGEDFVAAAQAMIRKDAQTHGAFYVCPVFNEMLLAGRRVGVYKVAREQYVSLATPQNVEEYEAAHTRQTLPIPRPPGPLAL